MVRYSKTIALAMALIGAGTLAHAAENAGNDALAVTQAKIPMSQAVTAAEQHVQGKASRAEYEASRGVPAYDVEVVNGTKVFDVKVDANTGAVIGATADKADHDNGEHEDGHED